MPRPYNPPVAEAPTNTLNRIDRAAMIAGPVLVGVAILWLAGRSGPDRPGASIDAVWALLTSVPWALGWLIAAIGLGWPLRRWLTGKHRDQLAIQVGLGVAAMLTLDAGLGALGVLQWGGSLGAWALVLAGMALVVEQLRRANHGVPRVPWLTWTAAPAVAVLLLAACWAPGRLWASEFGGYDALSYHLQLPKEWFVLGRITPLDHNVLEARLFYRRPSDLEPAVRSAFYFIDPETESWVSENNQSVSGEPYETIKREILARSRKFRYPPGNKLHARELGN